MATNQSLFSLDYNIHYSDLSVLKIIEKQSIIPLTESNDLHSRVLDLITSDVPQLGRALPYYNLEYMSRLKEVAKNFKNKFKNIVVVGMGGGILNGMCLHDFSNNDNLNFIFATKICASYLSGIKNAIDLKVTGFIFISNSGDTVETVVSAEYWYGALLSQQITDFSERFVFIYSSKTTSLLQDLHIMYGGIYFQYDPKMGGRFSTFTTPHLLIAILSGVDLDNLFIGANNILDNFISHNQELNKLLYSGALFTIQSFNQYHNTTILIGSYNSELNGLTKWYHTAIAETFGRDKINISPINLDLPIDQHGLMQAILTNNTAQILNLFSIKSCSNAKIDHIQKILQSEVIEQCTGVGIPIREFILNNTHSRTLGSLIMYIILETITAAALMNINPFIQPKIDNMKKNIAKKYRDYTQQGVP
jgi:glucose-6-phosphate isomerase